MEQPGTYQTGKDQQFECACMLTHAYADLNMLYLLLAGAHRNVTGPNFYSLHTLFGELYEAIAEETDRLGEHIRGNHRMKLPISPEELREFSIIQFPESTCDPLVLIESALMGHEQLKKDLHGALEKTTCPATRSLIEEFCETACNRMYLIRSHYGA